MSLRTQLTRSISALPLLVVALLATQTCTSTPAPDKGTFVAVSAHASTPTRAGSHQLLLPMLMGPAGCPALPQKPVVVVQAQVSSSLSSARCRA